MSLDTNRIITGDALDVLRSLPDKSIDMIFTDPPYGHNNNNGDLIQRREAALGLLPIGELNPRPIANDGPEANDIFQACLPEYARLLKPGGVCCCCCCGGGGPDPQFARWSLWMDGTPGLSFVQMVVWDKGPIGMGWRYRRSYETVLVAYRTGANMRWHDTTKRVENIIRPRGGAPKIIPGKDQHPTEKPVGLGEIFIRLHTQPGDIVLDPFAGSGTTLVAARNLGRRYLGIELNPEYVAIAERRLAQPYTMPMLFGEVSR